MTMDGSFSNSKAVAGEIVPTRTEKCERPLLFDSIRRTLNSWCMNSKFIIIRRQSIIMAGNSSRFFQSADKRRRIQKSESSEDAVFEASQVPGCIDNPLIIDEDCEVEESNTQVTTKSNRGSLDPFPENQWQKEKSNSHLDTTTTTTTILDSSEASSPPPTTTETTVTASSPRQNENPFSQFAFQKNSSNFPARLGLSWRPSSTSMCQTNTTRKVTASKKMNKKTMGQKKENKACEFVPMRSISQEEQERVTKKWHSLADPSAPLETRRFQVLVAARLHARCQEVSVRKAMAVLREAFPELTVSTVAKADPDVLAHYITNLQYYNTKAQQIVKAAREIQVNFNGIVPEDEISLLKITGVGKVFADLLAFVNTRKVHGKMTPEDTQEMS